MSQTGFKNRYRIFWSSVFGGFAGLVISYLLGRNVENKTIWTYITPLLAGGLAGLVLGWIIFRRDESHHDDGTTITDASFAESDPTKMLIREERLNISKHIHQLAEVSTHKEMVTEEINLTIPIQREVLVVETKILDKGCSNQSPNIDTIRIPIREEQIEIIKHPVNLQDVTIKNNIYEEVERIEQSLKKEKLVVEKSKDDIVVNEVNKVKSPQDSN